MRKLFSKKVNNRKGFTLVELLVTMVILGIITGMSIPLVRNVQNNNENKKYSTYADSLLSAAKLYNDSYSEDLFGNKTNGCAYITYQDLYEKDLIKNIQIDGMSCDTASTFVRVIKIGDKYNYTYFLGCSPKGSTNILVSLPEADTVYTMDLDACGGTEGSSIIIKANPEKADAKYNAKTREADIRLISAMGINPGPKLRYYWELNGTKVSEPHLITFGTIPTVTEQKNSILSTGEIINIKSAGKLQSPSGLTGDLKLKIIVDKLNDAFGVAWKNPKPEDGNVVTYGVYKVDNQQPKIESVTIKSKEKDYNSVDTEVVINAHDYDKTPVKDLKYCITTKSSCTDKEYVAYKTKYDFKVANDYDGKEKTINIFVKDLAGNISKSENKYLLPAKYTLTYDSTGGSACNPNTKIVLVTKGVTTKWGDLCSPTKSNNQFDGWYTEKNGKGDRIDKNTVVNGNLKVYAKWRASRVVFRIQLQSSDSITTPTSDGTDTYRWKMDTADNKYYYLYRSINNAPYELYTFNVSYNSTTMNLPDYDNSSYINIKNGSLKAKSGAEWKCTSGCKTNGMTFSHSATSVNPNDICDTSKGDCKVTLQVNWVTSKVKIKMNANGGTMASSHGSAYSISSNKILKNGGETIHELVYGSTLDSNGLTNYNNSSYLNVVKDGYSVERGKEWICKSGCSQNNKIFNQDSAYAASDFCSAENGDCTVTLYINWQKNSYKITYKGDGSTTGSTADTDCIFDTDCTLSGNGFSKTGFTFTGWKIGSTMYAAGDKVKNLTSIANDTVTANAQWTANKYKIVYNGNGSTSGSTANTECVYSVDCTLNSNGFSKTGSTFIGWKIGTKTYSAGEKVKNLTSTAGGTVTAKAQWKLNTHTITYNGNGNTGGSMTATTCDHNASCTLKSNTFTKTHYQFDGWYSKATGGTKYGSTTTLTSNITVYAHWKKKTYTITYNGNGNTGGSTASTACEYGAACTLRANGFTRTGYKFTGWYTTATGSVQYSSSVTLSANITAYAHWEKDTISASCNNGSGSWSNSTSPIRFSGSNVARYYYKRYDASSFSSTTSNSANVSYYKAKYYAESSLGTTTNISDCYSTYDNLKPRTPRAYVDWGTVWGVANDKVDDSECYNIGNRTSNVSCNIYVDRLVSQSWGFDIRFENMGDQSSTQASGCSGHNYLDWKTTRTRSVTWAPYTVGVVWDAWTFDNAGNRSGTLTVHICLADGNYGWTCY